MSQADVAACGQRDRGKGEESSGRQSGQRKGPDAIPHEHCIQTWEFPQDKVRVRMAGSQTPHEQTRQNHPDSR